MLKDLEQRHNYDNEACSSGIARPKNSVDAMLKSVSNLSRPANQIISVQRMKNEKYKMSREEKIALDFIDEDSGENDMRRIKRIMLSVFLLSLVGNYYYVKYVFFSNA